MFTRLPLKKILFTAPTHKRSHARFPATSLPKTMGRGLFFQKQTGISIHASFVQDAQGCTRGGRDRGLLYRRLEDNVDGRHDRRGQSVVGGRADGPGWRPWGVRAAVRDSGLPRHGRERGRCVAGDSDNQ